jgi:hypothetical protein
MIRLRIREGGTVRTVVLEGDRAVLGTAAAVRSTDGSLGPADPVVALAAPGVDARHALLRPAEGGGFEVMDLGSVEGVILGGRRVRRSPVAPGGTLLLGGAAVEVEALAPAEAPPAATALAAAAAATADAGNPVPPPDAPPPPLLPGRGVGRLPADFNFALYTTVRASPPWLLSAGVHGAFALLILLLAPDPVRRGPVRSLVLGEGRDAAESALDADPEPTPPRPPAPSDDAALDAAGGADPLDPSDPRHDRDGIPLPDDPVAPTPAELGFGGGTSMAGKPVHFDEDDRGFAPGGDGAANRDAALKVVESLGGRAAPARAALGRLDPRRVLVVKGEFDHVEQVFDLLGIGHDTLGHDELANAPLPPDAVLVVDCGRAPLGEAAAARVRAFVRAGGFLVTTDWGLENVIERALPGAIASLHRGGAGPSTDNEVLRLRLAAPAHPLVRGVRGAAAGAAWWVEDRAYGVKVLDAARVTVLVESPELQRRWGHGALAVTWAEGSGRVLHLVGHAWQKEGNLRGTFAIQRLLLNFLVERGR